MIKPARKFATIGHPDDLSTMRTVQIFVQTGHFTYNGRETEMEGWQIL